jgi:hypothetical protein
MLDSARTGLPLLAVAAAVGCVSALKNNWPRFVPTFTGNVSIDFPQENPGVFSESSWRAARALAGRVSSSLALTCGYRSAWYG